MNDKIEGKNIQQEMEDKLEMYSSGSFIFAERKGRNKSEEEPREYKLHISLSFEDYSDVAIREKVTTLLGKALLDGTINEFKILADSALGYLNADIRQFDSITG